MVWTVAGIAAGAAVLMGVMGAARADEPKKTPPAKAPAVSPAATPGATSPGKKPGTEATPASSTDSSKAVSGEVLGFKVNLIDGKAFDLSKYKGSVVVIVNVASKCGFTGQYAGLEELFKKHEKDGLVVLGFPANDFNGQEPGNNDEIAKFCSSTYGVTFPMFEKISVKGEGAHPLYKLLASQPAPIGGEPKWNFTKFVIDRNGKVAGRVDADRAYVRGKQIEPELEKLVVSLLATKPATGATPAQEPKKVPAAK
jgi:glutathione peroxidase